MINNKREKRITRHRRIRAKVMGTTQRPRLAIFRSNQHLHLQLIDDATGKTVASASTVKLAAKKPSDRIVMLSKTLAEKAVKLGVSEVVFDRAGYRYHGNVAKVASEIRNAGLKF